MITPRRFPKRKYLRQLYRMLAELDYWRRFYALAMLDHPDDWLGSRFTERWANIDEAMHRIDDVLVKLGMIT